MTAETPVRPPRLVVAGPLPPPIHGVTVSTSLVLANEALHKRFEVHHLDTSDRRGLQNLGHWELRNVLIGLRSSFRLVQLLGPSKGVLYLPLSQNRPAFLRDSLFIHLASSRGWRVAAHLRGGEFDVFYARHGIAFRFWVRKTLQRITSIAVLGPSLARMFDELLPMDRVAVVHNGTPEINNPGGARRRTRVLFMANLLRRKGVVEAVEAAASVVAVHPSATFIFAGAWEDEELASELRGRVADSDDRIEFRSPVSGSEKEILLAESGIFLFPPREPEGHPRAVLEAMSAGLPVVTTNRGALRHTVVDGETGFVLEEPRPAEIADRILLLLNDPERQAAMGQAARQRHLGHFTQEKADLALADWLEMVVMVGSANA